MGAVQVGPLQSAGSSGPAWEQAKLGRRAGEQESSQPASSLAAPEIQGLWDESPRDPRCSGRGQGRCWVPVSTEGVEKPCLQKRWSGPGMWLSGRACLAHEAPGSTRGATKSKWEESRWPGEHSSVGTMEGTSEREVEEARHRPLGRVILPVALTGRWEPMGGCRGQGQHRWQR